MKKVTAGSVTGGMTDGQEIHSDFPGEMMRLPQANGGVPTRVTTHHENSGEAMPQERGVGDMSRDEYGSMNGRQAGETRSHGGVDINFKEGRDARKSKFHDGHPQAGGIHRQY